MIMEGVTICTEWKVEGPERRTNYRQLPTHIDVPVYTLS